MIEVYRADAMAQMHAERVDPVEGIPPDAIWIDMINPTKAEEHMVEAMCAIEVPTREEMREIEVSSRLYSEDNADFMTASVVYGLDTGSPAFAPVTFILSGKRLVTLRYTEPKSFAIYAAKLCRDPSDATFRQALTLEGEPVPLGALKASKAPSADGIMIGLVETVIDRVADMMEAIAADLDRIASDIFAASTNKAPTANADFKSLLQRIGRAGDLASRTRESLATLDRMMPYLQFVLDRRKGPKDAKARVKAMSRDITSLNDFVAFLSNKTTFLLDTTVGMISIEQNAIIKIFSVAAVGFMPPTLVASIYGMNFAVMPELSWHFGYPLALSLMLVSAVLPLIFFRHKNWL
jgi:magnesium transporter